MDARHAEVWRLVDERIGEVRRLPFDELCRRASGEPEVQRVEGPTGAFRRRARIVVLGDDRVGIRVSVDCDGRRPRAERGVIVTPEGRLAPEWSFGDEPPRPNPFVFGPRVTIAGVALAIVALVVFLVLT